MNPIPANPIIIIAHVEGSGTPATGGGVAAASTRKPVPKLICTWLGVMLVSQAMQGRANDALPLKKGFRPVNPVLTAGSLPMIVSNGTRSLGNVLIVISPVPSIDETQCRGNGPW